MSPLLLWMLLGQEEAEEAPPAEEAVEVEEPAAPDRSAAPAVAEPLPLELPEPLTVQPWEGLTVHLVSAPWALLPCFGPDCTILNFVKNDCRCHFGFLPFFVIVVDSLKVAACDA